MNKQYFIVSDVHGFYNELQTALDKAGFDINNPDHIFVNLGDLMDRGEYPLKCLKFVNGLPDDRKILIRGNHEDLMEEAICRRRFLAHDAHNRTDITAIDLSDVLFTGDTDTSDEHILELVKKNPEYDKYINSTIDYFEDEHCIFTHGWIPCRVVLRDVYEYDSKWRNGDWAQARWINGMSAWDQGVREPGKTIFCGHWHTSWGHAVLHNDGPEWNNPYSTNPAHAHGAKFTPFIDDGIIAVDACTAMNHFVNCVVIDAETGKQLNEVKTNDKD